MSDPIVSSIDAVLDNLDGISSVVARLQQSASFQRLALANVARMLDNKVSLTEQIALITACSVAVGYEAGRAAAHGEKMEELFA